MKRLLEWKTTPSGKVVTCTLCSWWIPLIGDNMSAAAEEFDGHVCSEHPPVREMGKPSNAA